MAKKSHTSKTRLDDLKLRDEFGIDPISRTIWITGEILSLQSLEYLDSRLAILEEDSDKEITIKINSPGGCIYESAGMAGRIANSPCPIVTEVFGIAMSGALSLLAVGDFRRVSRFASLMHHQASTMIYGQTGKMTKDLRAVIAEDKRRMEFLAEYSNKPMEWWEDVCKHGDYYITPAEALSIGLIDEVF